MLYIVKSILQFAFQTIAIRPNKIAVTLKDGEVIICKIQNKNHMM